jgi:hypothetical protein
MEINIFNDPNKVPKSRSEIKIEDIVATPYADRFRVKAEISVTAFLERPNLLVMLKDAQGKIVHELNIIETMHYEMEFTFHLRGIDEPAGEYTLEVELFYETRNPPQDRGSIKFTIPEADDE